MKPVTLFFWLMEKKLSERMSLYIAPGSLPKHLVLTNDVHMAEKFTSEVYCKHQLSELKLDRRWRAVEHGFMS